MEIKIIPNWSSPAQGYIDVPGTYNVYQINNPTAGILWIFSSVEFVVGSVIRVTQQTAGTYNAKVNSVVFNPIFSAYDTFLEPLNGSADLSNILSIEEPYYDEGAFQLDGVIEVLLNFRIFDLKEMKRSSTFTKTVDIPFTKNNDKIFTQIFNINVTNGFNPKKKSDCVITDGGVLIASGYLQVQEIDIESKLYKCVFYGENKNLFDDIGDKYVFGNSDREQNLNFDDTVHNKLKSEIEASWNGQRDFVYSMVKTNNNQITAAEVDTTGIPTTKLYPHLRAKYVVDKIFQKWGYEYDSNFFNTDNFKNVLILPSLEKPTGSEWVEYQVTNDFTVAEFEYVTINFNNKIMDEFDNSYNATTKRFKVPYKDRFTVSGHFGFDYAYGTYNSLAQAQAQAGRIRLVCNIYRRGVKVASRLEIASMDEFAEPLTANRAEVYIDDATGLRFNHAPIPFDFLANDEIEFQLNVPKTGINRSFTGTVIDYYTIRDTYSLRNDSYEPWLAIENESFQSNLLPTFLNVKQVDILGDIIKMFNLYIKPDKTNPRKFMIEPRDDFYKRGKVVSNLNYDVNSVQISYLNDLAARKYYFSHSQDNDYANKTFADNNKGRIFGDAQIELDNDFLNNEKKIQLVAAPTQFTPRYEFRNVYLPSIQNEDLTKPTTSFKTRFYYYTGLRPVKVFVGTASLNSSIKFNLNTTATQSAVYNYADFPSTSNYIAYEDRNSDSLLFAVNGSVQKENSLYYNYYENEIETYADQSSHILTLSVELNTKILQSIDFNDLYYFEIGGNSQYYTLLSIENYDPMQTTMATMKFLTYYDYRGRKTKRSRFVADVGYIGDVGIGDVKNVGDISIGDGLGGGIKGGGSNTGDGMTNIKNGIFVGDGNAMAGNNEKVFFMGDNNIFKDGVKKTFVFGDDNTIETSGLITFDSGKTYSTPDQFAFGDFNPVLSKRDIETFTNSTEGMLVYGGTSSGLQIYDGSGFTYIGGGSQSATVGPTGPEGPIGPTGPEGPIGPTGSFTLTTYRYFIPTDITLTAGGWSTIDTYTSTNGGEYLVTSQLYVGATGTGDILNIVSTRLSDGGGIYYASAESSIQYPNVAYAQITMTTIVNLAAGSTLYFEAYALIDSVIYADIQEGVGTKATQWNLIQIGN